MKSEALLIGNKNMTDEKKSGVRRTSVPYGCCEDC